MSQYAKDEDPFGFGPGKVGAPAVPRPATPDDLLFDAPATLPAAAGKKRSSVASGWDAPEMAAPPARSAGKSVAAALGTFEVDAAPAQRPAGKDPKAKSSRSMQDLFSAPVPSQAPPTEVNQSGVRRLIQTQKAPAPAVEAVAAPVAPRRRRGPLTVVLPLAIVGGGAAAALWLQSVQHNPVLAGIVGALALFGGALVWIAVRH